jgi:hypothetical protein
LVLPIIPSVNVPSTSKITNRGKRILFILFFIKIKIIERLRALKKEKITPIPFYNVALRRF